ncbi:thioester reductase domain-containing protein [Paenibacillus sp. sgz500958]|uniref:thioester reductase domain-containing protein n=1 Tax=Paenibacillus sp. sgz500958 TaxID=3242475 RepID=UPI0036D2439A
MSSLSHEIFILASFTANLLETYLEQELKEAGIHSRIATGPYNQIISQCMNEESVLYKSKPQYLVVWTRFEDILGSTDFYRKESLDAARSDLSMLMEAVLHAKNKINTKVIFILPAVIENRPLGLGDFQITHGTMVTSMLLRKYMLDKLQSVDNVFLADGEELIRRFGADQSYNMGMYAFAKVPFVNRIYQEAASAVSRIIRLDVHNKRNILVFDADVLFCEQEVLSGPGTLREVEEERLITDDSYLLFQIYLKELVNWGHEILLCTKSSKEALHRIFRTGSLGVAEEHFKYMCCECDSISDAIAEIHNNHGIPLEQFIVMDTRDLELNGVRQLLLPEDSTLWMQTMEASDVLDYIPDAVEFYGNVEESFVEPAEAYNLEDFLHSMNLEVSLQEVNETQADKIEHILHGTKDFNLTGRVWSHEEILAMLQEKAKVIYAVKVQDRFGDYGIAGAVIGTINWQEFSFTIDNLLLNCRVLGKNAEFHLVKQLVDSIQEYGCDSVVMRYESNGRNELAAEFLTKITQFGMNRILAGVTLTIPCELISEYADTVLQSKKKAGREKTQEQEHSVSSLDPYRFIADKWNKMKADEKEQVMNFVSSNSSIEEIMHAIADSKVKTRAGIQVEYIQPRTETELKIAELWGEVLNIDQVGVLDNFFGLGGTSIMAAQLIVKFKNAFGVKLPVRIFFDNSSVEQMAMYIDALKLDEDKQELNETAVSNFRYKTREFLKSEVWLDEKITGQKEWEARGNGRIENVLLTGGTGFLGAFLLEELIARTDYHIVLLVRSGNIQSGYERIIENMKQYDLWKEVYRSRFEVYTGDLSKPLLGQSIKSFNELAEKIDMIYHAGAITNFLEPYKMIKDVNVQGVQEILRLASTYKLKPVHYVSTHYVFSNLAHEHGFIAYEDTMPSSDEVLVLGYQQSKWVGENIMALAKERGIPVSIYRVGRISGSSTTGACQTKDIMWLMIKCCVEAGVLFDEDVKIEFIPVDYVSKSIIALSIQEESINRNFHIAGKAMNSLHQVYEWMKKYGFKVEIMPYDRWKDELVERVAKNPDLNTTKAMLPFIPEDMAEWDVEITYDETNVLRALRGTGITCPVVEEEIFTRYLDYFVKTKYFEFNTQAQTVR